MNLNLSLPINSVSFGAISYNILKELYNRGISPNVFPIGGVDLSSFDRCGDDFKIWLEACIRRAPLKFKKDYPEFRLWHIGQSDTSHSKDQTLLTFFETDSPQDLELNILSNQKRVYFTSEYTRKIFEDNGLINCSYLPLGFDSENYRKLDKHAYDSKAIVFGICGKWEKRKATEKMIKLWVGKYGNNAQFRLHIHCFNGFFHQDPQQCNQINQGLIAQALGGKTYWNVNVINGHLPTSTEYNQLLNSIDIQLCGANENWGLPQFNSTALGKYVVAVNSNGVKSWATPENSILIEPNGKEECYDGMFFNKGQPINQGNFFTFDDTEFISGMETAVEKYQTNPVNKDGLKLANEFKWSNTVDTILNSIK